MTDRARGDGQTSLPDGRTPLGLPENAPAGALSVQSPPPAASVRASLAPASAVDGVEPLVVDPGSDPARLTGPDRRGRATLAAPHAAMSENRSVLILDPPPGSGSRRRGVAVREIVVDGWRVEVQVEPARLAAIRERATRGRAAAAHGGPTEVHAIIPGRVVGVSIAPGDDVIAGQQLLVVEAMKMQNELRSPRDGRIERVAVAVGQTIEVGDLLLVLT